MRKFELLLLSKTIQKHKDTAEIVAFLTELLNQIELKKFFITYEMILFIYNVVINAKNDYVYLLDKNWKVHIRHQIIQIIQKVFNNSNELTPQNINKINNDIDYIEKHKKYTYIYDVIWYSYYFFF
jgi:hypothetical protein